MFICQACNNKEWGGQLFSLIRSYGLCEMCGNNGDCVDIPSRFLPKSKSELASTQLSVGKTEIQKPAPSLLGKVILVDMDGTICKFTKELLARAHTELGAPLIREEDCTHFHTENEFEPHFRDAVAKLSDVPDFFENLEPVEGAIEALLEMEALGANVFICTSPKKFYHNPHCAGEKHRWVMKYLGKRWTERVILSRDKTLVHGAVLIDDKPDVEGVAKPTWKHVYFDQPYNRGNSRPRITDWKKWKEVLIPLLG
jgi:5'-nucleotidase